MINTRADEMRADLHKLLFLSLVPVFLNLFDITNVLELKYSFVTQISVLFKVRCLRYVPFDDHILCILKKKNWMEIIIVHKYSLFNFRRTFYFIILHEPILTTTFCPHTTHINSQQLYDLQDVYT